MKRGSLGSLNPTPWAFMTGNCIGWIAYSFVTLDLFVFFANAPGVSQLSISLACSFTHYLYLIQICLSQLMISIWLNVGAMKLQYYEKMEHCSSIQLTEGQTGEGGAVENEWTDALTDDEDNETQSANGGENHNNSNDGNIHHKPPPSFTSHELKLISVVLIWVGILSTTTLMSMNKDDMEFVIGVTVNLNLIVFFGAPLSTIMTVYRTKSSASIHIGTMTMNTSNAFFWCIYALAIGDYYILIPNSLGFLFGVVQMCLCMTYPRSDINKYQDGLQFLDEESNSNDNSRASQTEII